MQSRCWVRGAAWRDQKSEIQPWGPRQDSHGVLEPLGHFCPPLLLNRLLHILREFSWDRPFPVQSVASLGILWHLGSAVGGVKGCQMVCVLFGSSPLFHPFCQWSMSLSLSRSNYDWLETHLLSQIYFLSDTRTWPWHSRAALVSEAEIKDGLCLKGAHGVTGVEWLCTQNCRQGICFQMSLWCYIKITITLQTGFNSLSKHNEPVQLEHLKC